MALVAENSWKIVETHFPFLIPPRGITFNQKNLEEICDLVSSQLIRLQDQEGKIQEIKVEPKQKTFEKLDNSGLKKSEVEKCLEKSIKQLPKSNNYP